MVKLSVNIGGPQVAIEVSFNENKAPEEVHDTLLLARTRAECCHHYLIVTVACDLAASPGLTPGSTGQDDGNQFFHRNW